MSLQQSRSGTLYGIGVGPGDPDLISIRAVSILQKTHVVLAACSSKNTYSTALRIARAHLPEDVKVHLIAFPMTRDKKALEAAWAENARQAAAILGEGQDAAFLTLGDPLIYSTFGYLMRTLNKDFPNIPIEVVPGITSYQAAAAKSRTVLCEDNENFLLLPGILPEEELTVALESGDNAVILKAYKNLDQIRSALAKARTEKDSLFITRLGLDGEQICPLDAAPGSPNYLSLVLATRKNRV